MPAHYRVIHGQARIGDQVYVPGSEPFPDPEDGRDLSRALVENGGNLERVEDSDLAATEVAPPPAPVDEPADLSSLKLPELRRMAQDIEVEGTGPGGRVTKSDLISALEAARDD